MNGYEVMKQVGKCPECGCTEFVINSEVSGTVSYLMKRYTWTTEQKIQHYATVES